MLVKNNLASLLMLLFFSSKEHRTFRCWHFTSPTEEGDPPVKRRSGPDQKYGDDIMELVFGKVFPEPTPFLDEVEKICISPTLWSQYSDNGGLPLLSRTSLKPTYCPSLIIRKHQSVS
uniref:Uncharacterized protein n=2 Tax=Nothobranchius furzeri TaxID=105023 RepID=A0A1A7ZQ94_NOTFU